MSRTNNPGESAEVQVVEGENFNSALAMLDERPANSDGGYWNEPSHADSASQSLPEEPAPEPAEVADPTLPRRNERAVRTPCRGRPGCTNKDILVTLLPAGAGRLSRFRCPKCGQSWHVQVGGGM